MADSTNDVVPLTPLVVDVVTFDRAPLGRRGYHEDQVDEYLDRVQATLAGTDNLTAQEVREVVFDAAPLIRRGYHEDQVDDFLDLVITELDNRERTRAAQRQPSSRPAAPPAGAAEQTSPVLPKLPAEQSRAQSAAANPSFPAAVASRPWATASGPSFPPAAASSPSLAPAAASGPSSSPAAASPRATSPSFPPPAASAQAPASNPSFPAAPAPSPSFPTTSAASPSAPNPSAPSPSAAGPSAPNPSAPNPSAAGQSAAGQSAPNPSGWPGGTQQPPAMAGRGPLALPLPPTPPNERGYHPADVARLVALLKEPSEPPSSAAITGMRLNRMDVGQGYHAGAVDAMRAIWITELRRRGL